jgi:integrase
VRVTVHCLCAFKSRKKSSAGSTASQPRPSARTNSPATFSRPSYRAPKPLGDRVLKVDESKAGKGRPVPLTRPAWAALDLWASRSPDRKPEHFVFPACEKGRIDPERPIADWRTAWRRACREAALKGLRFHDLRHTAASKLLEQGTPIVVVAQILGRSASTAVRMAKRYGHIRPETQRRALEAVATAEIQPGVNQIVHQAGSEVESELPN